MLAGHAARGGRPVARRAARAASTCPTSSPPARATSSCRPRARRRRARAARRRPSRSRSAIGAGEGTPAWVKAMAVALDGRDRARSSPRACTPRSSRARGRPAARRRVRPEAPDALVPHSRRGRAERDRVMTENEPHGARDRHRHPHQAAQPDGSRTAAIVIASMLARALAPPRCAARRRRALGRQRERSTTRATSRPPPTPRRPSTIRSLTTEARIALDADSPELARGRRRQTGRRATAGDGAGDGGPVFAGIARTRRSVRALPSRRVQHRGHRHRHRPVRCGVRRARRGAGRPADPAERQDIWAASARASAGRTLDWEAHEGAGRSSYEPGRLPRSIDADASAGVKIGLLEPLGCVPARRQRADAARRRRRGLSRPHRRR